MSKLVSQACQLTIFLLGLDNASLIRPQLVVRLLLLVRRSVLFVIIAVFIVRLKAENEGRDDQAD